MLLRQLAKNKRKRRTEDDVGHEHSANSSESEAEVMLEGFDPGDDASFPLPLSELATTLVWKKELDRVYERIILKTVERHFGEKNAKNVSK